MLAVRGNGKAARRSHFCLQSGTGLRHAGAVVRTEGALQPYSASKESSGTRSRTPGPVAPALPSACLSCVWVTFLAQNSMLLNSGSLKFRDSKQIDKHLSYNIRNQPKSNLFTKMKGGGPPRPQTENQDITKVNTLHLARPYYPPDLHVCAALRHDFVWNPQAGRRSDAVNDAKWQSRSPTETGVTRSDARHREFQNAVCMGAGTAGSATWFSAPGP